MLLVFLLNLEQKIISQINGYSFPVLDIIRYKIVTTSSRKERISIHQMRKCKVSFTDICSLLESHNNMREGEIVKGNDRSKKANRKWYWWGVVQPIRAIERTGLFTSLNSLHLYSYIYIYIYSILHLHK